MDQVATTHELEYKPEKAMSCEFGYDREAIAFLGMSRLKGVGFQTLTGLGGRAGISQLLDRRSVSEFANQVFQPGASKTTGWEEFSRKVWTLGQEVAQELIARRVRFIFAGDARFHAGRAAPSVAVRCRGS